MLEHDIMGDMCAALANSRYALLLPDRLRRRLDTCAMCVCVFVCQCVSACVCYSLPVYTESARSADDIVAVAVVVAAEWGGRKQGGGGGGGFIDCL